VRRDAGREQLVRAEPEQVEQFGVELVERPVHALGQDRVVAALGAQGAVGELGRQGGVAGVEAALGEQAGQHEVRVRVVLGDRAQRVVRGAPGRIC
jgi:hypothetical protein